MIWKSQHGKWVPAALHGAARGLTAVLVCHGPSLNAVDTARLAGPGRVVIGINSTYPQVRPDYWLGMDTPENYPAALFCESFPKMLRSGTHNKMALETHRDLPGVHFMDVREVADWQEAVFAARDGAPPVWFKDTFRVAVQFALHLGCTRLVFAGVDLDNGQQTYADARALTPAQRSYNAALYAQQWEWLQWFVPAAQARGVACVSLSPGSRIGLLMPEITVDRLGDIPATASRPAQHCTAPWLVECNEVEALRKRGGKPYSKGHQAMYRTVVELLREAPATVNEFGFGIGYGLGELLKADCVRHYWGCEPCAEAYEHTRAAVGVRPEVTLVRGGWRDVEVPEADYALVIEVLEHLPPEERAPFLQRLRSTTRKALFLSTPDAATSLHGVVTPDELLTLMASCGWRAVAVSPQWTTFYLATPLP